VIGEHRGDSPTVAWANIMDVSLKLQNYFNISVSWIDSLYVPELSGVVGRITEIKKQQKNKARQ